MKTVLKDYIREHKIVATLTVVIAATVFFAIAWNTSGSIRGRLHAKFDITRGHYKVLGYGLPPASRPEYARLLQERFGIEFQAVAGCVVSQSLISYVDSYNAASVTAAKRKFGSDIFELTSEDALRNWEHRTDRPASPSIVEELFPYAPEKTHDVACFRSFAPGVSMQTIVQRCGRPDDEMGSGVYVFVYHLQNGSIVGISTPYLERVDQAMYTDLLGMRSPLFSQGASPNPPKIF